MINDRLKTLMAEKGWTSRILSEKSGYAKNTINSWLRGAEYPETNAICVVSEAFRITPDFLMGYSDVPLKVGTKSRLGEVSVRIHRAMNRRKMTRQDLADRSGYYIDTIHRWLRGTRVPCSMALTIICDVLDTHPDYILGYTERIERKRE